MAITNKWRFRARLSVCSTTAAHADCSLQTHRAENPMRLRLLIVSLGFATSLAAFLFISGCKEKPAATVREVNRLDVKSAEAPNPIEDPRFKDFFDHVRAYIKIHNAADARVPSLKDTS